MCGLVGRNDRCTCPWPWIGWQAGRGGHRRPKDKEKMPSGEWKGHGPWKWHGCVHGVTMQDILLWGERG